MCLGEGRPPPQSKCKSNKKAAIITCLVVDLFACLNGIGGALRYNGLSYALPQFLELLPESFADGSQVNRKDELAVVRLCSSEYNSLLYSMGLLPVSNVAVCSLLKPTSRRNLSMLIY